MMKSSLNRVIDCDDDACKKRRILNDAGTKRARSRLVRQYINLKLTPSMYLGHF